MRLGLPDLMKMIKAARQTGYLRHGIRNPDNFGIDSAVHIKELDRAFLDAANSVGLTFVQTASYGESDQAFDDTDGLADRLIKVNKMTGKYEFNAGDIFDKAFPWFRVKMHKFAGNGLTDDQLNYWTGVKERI